MAAGDFSGQKALMITDDGDDHDNIMPFPYWPF